jgi:NADH:ubiquinone oxidoreductase subunit 6 (subunit J)
MVKKVLKILGIVLPVLFLILTGLGCIASGYSILRTSFIAIISTIVFTCSIWVLVGLVASPLDFSLYAKIAEKENAKPKDNRNFYERMFGFKKRP